MHMNNKTHQRTEGSQGPLIHTEHIGKFFGASSARRQVLFDVSVDIHAGECLAIIGGSGSGKSTLTRILLGLGDTDEGNVFYQGNPVRGRSSLGYQALRCESGLVFQNPFASLDPRWTVERSVAEPLRLQEAHRLSRLSKREPKREHWPYSRAVDSSRHADNGSGGNREAKAERDSISERVNKALATAGLEPQGFRHRYPSDLSGGQAQRVAIARAMVNEPRLLVADEPMSAIDVAARLQVLDAFNAVRAADASMALIMVSHDLGVVQHIADRILVLHDGHVVEYGSRNQILGSPQTAYTKRLIEAAML